MVTNSEVRCIFTACDPSDQLAVNTAIELQHIHTIETGTTFRARVRTRELLVAIRLRYAQQVFPLEDKVRTLRRRRSRGEPYLPGDLRVAEDNLRKAISRRAPFTMLIRSLVDPNLSDLFD